MTDHLSYNIAIVDDDPFMMELVSMTLDSIGFKHIHKATDGQEALKLAEIQPIDIFLCDLNMPNMDGVTFLRHLAEREFIGGIIILSGEDQKILTVAENIAKGHKLNILGALAKPLDKATFLRLLSDFAPKGGIEKKHEEALDFIDAASIQNAIKNHEFVVHFQPKVNLKTNALTGFESLVRWQHPEKGLISPDAFIPVVEEQAHLTQELTTAIFEKALQTLKIWNMNQIRPKISLNLSALLLTHLDLPDWLFALTEKVGVSPADIIVEITESSVAQDLNKAREILTRLSLKKFKLSLDDFGTGYASMHELQQLPFNELKIDKAFVQNAKTNHESQAILETSITLGQKLKLTTVAEGVETQEHADHLRELGCDIAQGYFYAKPITAEDVVGWIADRVGKMRGEH